jgi:hypothetical protein
LFTLTLNIIIIIIIPFIVLCKSKTIVGQLGPKASAGQNSNLQNV